MATSYQRCICDFPAKLSLALSADQIKSLVVVVFCNVLSGNGSIWLLDVAGEWVVIMDLLRLLISE